MGYTDKVIIYGMLLGVLVALALNYHQQDIRYQRLETVEIMAAVFKEAMGEECTITFSPPEEPEWHKPELEGEDDEG